MAAGLGTRMRSATPKHLHSAARPADGRLGAATSRASSTPIRSSSSRRPSTADAFDGVEVAVQEQPLGTGDAVRCRASGARGTRAGRPRPLRRHAAPHAGAPPRASSRPIAARTPRRPSSPSSRRPTRTTAASSATVTGASRRSSRRATRRRSSSRYARSTPRSTSSGPSGCGRCSSGSTPQNAQGELYLTDTVALLVAEGERVAVHKGGQVDGDRGREHARRARGRGGRAARPDQRGAHARGRDDRRPADDVDRRRGDDRARRGDPPVHGHPGASRASARAPRSGRMSRLDDAVVGEGAVVGPFCYLRPGTVLGAGAKAGTFVEIKNSLIGDGPRCLISRTSATPRSARARTWAPGSITANFPHEAGRPKGRTTDRPQRQGRGGHCVRRTGRGRRRRMDCSRLRDHGGCASERARDRARAPGEQGRTRWKAERLSRRFPGSRSTRTRPEVTHRPRDPADAAEAADGLRGPLASRARAAKIAERLDVELGEIELQDVRERRDVLPLRRVDPRRRRLHRADRLPARRPEPHGAPLHDPGREARLGEADHGGHSAGSRTRARIARRSRASRSRAGSSPTCSSSRAPTAC